MTSLKREAQLHCAPDRAFQLFTDEIDIWWPRPHRRTPDAELMLEAFEGGRLFERTSSGKEWVMARVTAVKPPVLLELEWFPGSPEAPTHVQIDFLPHEDGTLVRVTHTPGTATEMGWQDKVHLYKTGWENVLAALVKSASQ